MKQSNMSSGTVSSHTPGLLFCGLVLASALSACGGGGSGSSATASSPSASSPVASGAANASASNTDTAVASLAATTAGTVTGFASVIVDGTEIEDAQATTRVENADGSYTNVAVKLGQQVVVEQSRSGTASLITVGAAIVGSVSSVSATASEFKAAGQWVTVNADAAAGPVTVYSGGYTALSGMVAGDLVEVHGNAVYSTTKAAYVIQASRIEKLTAISSLRVTGKIASLDSTAKSFSMNGVTVKYASASVVPTTATLANDQTVVVWGSSLSAGTVPVLTATRLRVVSSTAATQVTAGAGQVSGLVSAYNATAKTFALDGLTVNLGSATVTPTGASIANGAYVQVSGSFGANGSLTASQIKVRQANTSTATATVRLSGAISSYASASSFVVRGIPVDASAISLATACPGVTLANGTVVDLMATQQTGTSVVKATSLQCRNTSTQSAFTMRGLSGTAGTVDATAKTFVLTLSTPTATSSTQKVLWNDQTAWGTGVSATSLNSAKLVLEGYLDASNVLVARSVRLQGTEDVDRFTTAAGTGGGWDDYDRNFRPGK